MNYLQKKKLAFMSIVNKVKGFIRTITGALPLTLEGCVDGKSIIDYTLYGQSVQDGTPTPDEPIEVESVGEKTRNLFNPKQTPVQIGNYLGMKLESDIYTLRIALKNNKNVPSGVYFGLLYGSHASWLIANGNVQQKQISLDLSTYTGIGVAVYSASGNTKAWNNMVDAFDIYLSEGYETTYEPYGYKIPIKVSGKNLFDINKFITLDGNSTYYEINENGELVQKASDYRGNTVLPTVAVLPIGTYIISGFGSWSTFRVVNKTTGEVIVDPKFTLTEPTEIAVKWWAKGGTVIGKPMLREGTTATDYEPYHEPMITNIYLDEPLRKVGEYADYVDFENGKVVRNVKSVTLKTAKYKYTWLNRVGVDFGSVLDTAYDRPKGLCNREKKFTANGNEQTAIWIGVNNTYIYWIGILDYLDFTTLDEINEWLTNNPTYVYYGSKKPTEIPITLPNIPTFKGASIISADTTIQPSNAEITYYSNVKE